MDEDIYTIDCDLCDYCEKIIGLPARHEEQDYEWGCVGLITHPQDPKDVHDNLNKIRICIGNIHTDHIDSHEWTVWEAQMVSMGLGFAIAKYLEDFQPTSDDIDRLLKNGFVDRLTEESKDVD